MTAIRRGARARLRVATLLGALLSITTLGAGSGCGGAEVRETEGADAEAQIERAARAWAELDAAGAAREAEEALRLEDDPQARQIAGRAHLALGQWDAAVRALSGTRDPELFRLRARAQLANDDLEGAIASLAEAQRRAREEDPWTEAMLPALRAAADRGEPYAVRGEAAALPLEALPLPVVRVRVDAVETLALVGSGSFLAVLDPSVRHDPGAIDELTLGELRLGDVPHIVRPLDSVRETLGAEIRMVIGADLLLRLHAVIDGPGATLRLSPEPARPAEGASRAPLLTLTGSFLAVESRLGRAPAWLTVDTAGLFPVALTPGTPEALGIAEADWQPTEAGPSIFVAPRVRLGALQVEDIPLVRGLLDEGHARAVGAPVAGSVGWALLGQLVTRFDGERRALWFE